MRLQFYTTGKGETRFLLKQLRQWTWFTVSTEQFTHQFLFLWHYMHVLAAVKLNYSAGDINELKIANSVKDWLKYAKVRMGKNKPATNEVNDSLENWDT